MQTVPKIQLRNFSCFVCVCAMITQIVMQMCLYDHTRNESYLHGHQNHVVTSRFTISFIYVPNLIIIPI